METPVLILFFIFSSLIHPLHVSLLNVDLNKVNGDIEVTFKVFSDDFQNIIFQKYGVELEITRQVDPGDKISVINNYIEDSFIMKVNGTRIDKWNYVKAEMNYEAIWLYYTCMVSGEIKTVTISNSLMMDLFSDQTNLVIISYEDQQKGYRLDNKKREISINL